MGEKPIRVAHIIGKMVGGGVESFIMNYYKNIDRTKIQFDFIIDSDSTVIPKKEIEKMGGRIIKISPYQHIFRYIRELVKIFKENEYKIVHSHLNSLSVFPLFCAYISKVPVRIAHSHSTTNKKEWKKNIIKNILRPFSKIFANNYFACSEYAGRWLFGNKAFDKGKVTIVKNSIDVKKFEYNEHTRKRIRNELGIDEKIVLGNVGRFVQQKNHEFLIDIFNQVYKENKNIVLVLLGEGPLESKIKNKVKKIGLEDTVYFLGVKQNVNEYMQAMDLFVFPSLYEGLGMVVIEAQCSGMQCIVSTELPKDVELTSLIDFLPLNYTEEWKDKILKYIKKPIERKGQEKIIIEKGYDIAVEFEKLANKYMELIK